MKNPNNFKGDYVKYSNSLYLARFLLKNRDIIKPASYLGIKLHTDSECNQDNPFRISQIVSLDKIHCLEKLIKALNIGLPGFHSRVPTIDEFNMHIRWLKENDATAFIESRNNLELVYNPALRIYSASFESYPITGDLEVDDEFLNTFPITVSLRQVLEKNL